MGSCNRFGRASGRVALGAVLLLLAARVPATAAEPGERDYGEKADTLGTPEARESEAAGPNRGRLSLTVASDITTAYFFRGILVERDGFIWQPYIELALNVFRGDGLLSSVDLGMGTWFSVQSEQTGATGEGPENLYEIDFYPSITATLSNGLSSSLSYIVYTSPNGAFSTVQQIDLGFAYDDSEVLGPFAVGPTATLSFEVDNGSDLGTRKGGYFELAGAPGFELEFEDGAAEDYPLAFTFPLALGLSMYDYYEFCFSPVDDDDNCLGPTHNQTFGFFSFGANAGVPLAFIPEDFGAWGVNLGINVYTLSQTLKNVNEGDNPYPVGTLSIAMQY
jgi:hypothetical protein